MYQMEGQDLQVTCEEGHTKVYKDRERFLPLQFTSVISLFHNCNKTNRNVTQQLTKMCRLHSSCITS